MQQYYFAEESGETVLANYDKEKRPTQKEVEDVIKQALGINGLQYTFNQLGDKTETYKISYKNGDKTYNYYVSLKPVTPGGRSSGINDEHRILQLPKFLNDIDSYKSAGKKTAFLGVYIRKGSPLICAWQVTHSNANLNNRISKQIKADTLAEAYKYGFKQQKKGNEYCCAFKKEFLYFFLQNCDWLCSSPVGGATATNTITYDTGLSCDKARNRIVFGAPGTGKSHRLEEDINPLLKFGGSFERVTFHPEYSYSQFVGTYKPVMDGKDITYRFVPGPFLRVWVEAVKNSRTGNPKPYLLIIEEINRARVAAVFGDVFQLLDRDDDGVSKYSIQTSEDIKRYLANPNVLGGNAEDYSEFKIPDNMLIWATMNSADQGVYVMDTAFKRRWDFEYIGIDKNDSGIKGEVELIKGDVTSKISWNKLRKAINKKLTDEIHVNEDKLLGPYYLSGRIIDLKPGTTDIADPDAFRTAFKNKVLMYLFEDAAKIGEGRQKLFEGCGEHPRYSEICDKFDSEGMEIFGKTFKNIYYDKF